MKIKVCGMRDAANIAAVAHLDPAPDMMGFIFYAPSPRNACTTPPEALDALPSATRRVGVFVDAPADEILATARRFKLNAVQLHGTEPPAMCTRLRGEGLGVMKTFGIATAADVARTAPYEGTCDLYVFDTRVPDAAPGTTHGGTGRKFDHRLLEAYQGTTPFLLSGGLGPEDALNALNAEQLTATRHPLCAGIDINSRFESAPGVKNPATIQQFLKNFKNPMNRIDKLFQDKPRGVLSVYFTAGYPGPDDTVPTIRALAAAGVDMLEVGIPFSDPMADGPVIQHSGTVALEGGMTLRKLFAQLEGIRAAGIDIPLVAMGYLNPIMQYGIEEFCASCARVGIDGVIIPDLPFADYLRDVRPAIDRHGLHFITLITPETSDERIRLIDASTSGFIYMVSTASTTGARDSFDDRTLDYFRRVDAMGLRNPRMIGFGISNRTTFEAATCHASGAIIGSAFIKLLNDHPIEEAADRLIAKVSITN